MVMKDRKWKIREGEGNYLQMRSMKSQFSVGYLFDVFNLNIVKISSEINMVILFEGQSLLIELEARFWVKKL